MSRSSRDGFRLRVGSYRVLFTQTHESILVVYVGRRNTTTYRGRPMTHQVIMTPGGEELVIIARAEFEALQRAAASAPSEEAEDADDIAMFDARMAALNEGRDFELPLEVSRLMLRGDSLLKALRKWKHLTQGAVAHGAGVAQGYLSDLEAGKKQGTPETLATIAAALDVDPRWLVV